MGNEIKNESQKEGDSGENKSTQEKIKELNNRATLLEQRLLNKFAYPLDYKSLYYENININLKGENAYLHTLVYGLNELKENPHSEKKVLIMLHGYQGNSISIKNLFAYAQI